jgi:mRNA interferase RelE/StbE
VQVLLLPRAQKQYKKFNEPLKSRIASASERLEEYPPQGDIKKLEGHGGFRVRIGDYRILFGVDNDAIIITAIEPRGGVYKR